MGAKIKLLPIFFIFLFFGCAKRINLNIEQGKYLLYNQSYKGNTFFAGEELTPYIKQKPNPKILGIRFSLYFYYLGLKFYDREKVYAEIEAVNHKYDSKIANADSAKKKKLEKRRQKMLVRKNNKLENGNWTMRRLGTPPAIFDTTKARASCSELVGFLKTKGCLNAKVDFKTDTILSAIFITYQLNEGKRYKINQLKYEVEDGNLKRLINEHEEQILLDTSAFYDEQKLIAERDRLEKMFLTYGYYEFAKKYIEFEIDTLANILRLKVKISNTDRNNYHKLFKIDKIKFKIDKNEMLDAEDSAYAQNYKGVHFAFGARRYYPKILFDKTEIKQGQKYNFQFSKNTQRNLAQLEVFKYVNLNYEKDTITDGLTAVISAGSTTKYQISDEIGFSVSQGLPGPFGSLTFLTRNVFNGCELFEINLRGGIEGVASATDNRNFYQSQELGLTTALTIPRLFFLFDLNPRFIDNNPRTKFQLGYNFISRPEYQRTNARLSMTYYLTKGLYNQFSFSLVDVSYLRTPFLQQAFADSLKSLFARSGNTLFRSFQPSIASNINFGYTYNNFIVGQNKNATYFRVFAESGGTTLNLVSKAGIQEIKKYAEVEALFVYWKLNVDLRKYFPITRKSTFATRINIGIANPYAGDGALPYEKYFFSGGSNSNRAWLPRRLGPGRFAIYNGDGSTNYNFEQPGLLQLEINEELRFKIFKFLDGALFIDAGNIWLIDDIDAKKNFTTNFISEIAIGTGYGLRFDFSFLIVRLDLGYKAYDPSQIGDKWLIKKTNFFNINDIINKATWNIAVGYPF
ncbi:MAG: BamA/TamA family outer membrane protein [Cytophagales bacterium]